MEVFKTIEREIDSYIKDLVPIVPGYNFSQYQLVQLIELFRSNKYETGNIDFQDNYKYWYDIIGPRVDTEVKNIDFDTKNVLLYTDNREDAARIFIANGHLKNWLRDSGQAVKINDVIEEYSGLGNIVLKRIKGGWELFDAVNFYVINQTARTLDDTPVVERHVYSAGDMRSKSGIWWNIEDIIRDYKTFNIKIKKDDTSLEDKEIPYYEVYERNGEIQLSELKEAMDQSWTDADEDIYVYAKIVCVATEGKMKKVLWAGKIKNPYLEAHRGRYHRRWWRFGMYELLMDIQVRANECGNQIARALEFGALQIYTTDDKLLVKNILTDIVRGDFIVGKNVRRLDTKMDDISNYITEWNLLMQIADRLSNATEVAQGEMPAGTPFRLGALLNVNANKLYDFMREKLSIAFTDMFNNWLLDDIMKDLRSIDSLRITGSPEYLGEYRRKVIESWYNKNLLSFGPHTKEQADFIKESMLNKFMDTREDMIKVEKALWDDFKPRIKVVIDGENVNLRTELQDQVFFIQLETDPVRRTALIEQAYAMKGRDVSLLPKSTADNIRPVQQVAPQANAPAEQPITTQ